MSLRNLARAFLAVALLTGVLAVVAAQPASAGTFDVTVSSPDNAGTANTLRWAIAQANGAAGPHEIRFNFAAPTTITLDCGGGGDLDYDQTGTLTLTNRTPNNVTISQTCADERVLEVASGSLVVNGGPGRITFSGGTRYRATAGAQGGAINVRSGTAELNYVNLLNNFARTDDVDGRAQGGGIFANGNVTVRQSKISGNDATSNMGAQALGGGIASNADVVVSDSEISDNKAESGSGGDIDQDRGGGIYAGGNVTVTSSKITGNKVINGNNDSARGGGIFGDVVEVTDSTLSSNEANGTSDVAQGGAIQANDSATILRSAITGNLAMSTGNAAAGGGIASPGPISVTNSTVSGNFARGTSDEGGGIWGDGSSAVVTLRFSTIISNEGAAAANVYARKSRIDGTATIIANPLGGGDNCRVDGPATANLTSYFWADDASCGLDGTGDIVNTTDPLPVLAGAAVNGAANGTLNHLPDITSPIPYQIINNAPCDGLTDDQRGVVRPQGDSCDRGSVELKGLSAVGDTAFTLTAAIGHPVTTTVLANDNLGEAGGTETVTIVTQPVLGHAVVNPDNTITFFPLPLITTIEEYTYEVCGPVNCDTAKVRVTVNGPPAPEFPEQPETSPTSGPEAGPTTVPRPPAKKPVAPGKAAPAGKTAPAGMTTAPKYTG